MNNYHVRKLNGQCTRCGGDRENPEFFQCRSCRLIENERHGTAYRNQLERINAGKEAMRDRTMTGLFEVMIRGGKDYVSEYDI